MKRNIYRNNGLAISVNGRYLDICDECKDDFNKWKEERKNGERQGYH